MKKLTSVFAQPIMSAFAPDVELYMPIFRFGNGKKNQYRFPCIFENKEKLKECIQELQILVGKNFEDVKNEVVPIVNRYASFNYTFRIDPVKEVTENQ